MKVILSPVLSVLCLLIVITLFIALPSVVMPELMHPTQTGKSIVFFYGMMAIGVMVVLRVITESRFTLRINVLDVALLSLLAYITINRYWIQPIHGFSMKYYELIGLSALYIILRGLPKRFFPYLLLAIIAGGIIQAIYGSLQLWGYYPSHHSGFRMTGSFFNPGPYAGYLASVFPVALGMYLYRHKFLKSIFLRKKNSAPLHFMAHLCRKGQCTDQCALV